MAQKSRRRIKLAQSVEAKINQFTDGTNLICGDVNTLRENMNTSEYMRVHIFELRKMI